MKIKSILMSTVIATSALTMKTTYAGNSTNTALTSALGGVVGAAITHQHVAGFLQQQLRQQCAEHGEDQPEQDPAEQAHRLPRLWWMEVGTRSIATASQAPRERASARAQAAQFLQRVFCFCFGLVQLDPL